MPSQTGSIGAGRGQLPHRRERVLLLDPEQQTAHERQPQLVGLLLWRIVHPSILLLR